MSLNNLSVDLGEAGRRAEALAAIQEAVTVSRRLAAANAAAYEPALATSLNNLSIRLGEAGRPAEALAAIQEAVTVYRRLAAANAAAYEPDLATSLNNLSIRLGEADDPPRRSPRSRKPSPRAGAWRPPTRPPTNPTSRRR